MLKIIAGKHRGRKIETLQDKEVRPTTGFLREAVFNILMHGQFSGENSPIVGKRVVDIFSGTGAMGFEALSRGAAHVTLVDQNVKAIGAARTTAEKLGELNNVAFLRSDSTNLPPTRTPCSLAFIDPPYNGNLVKPALNSLVKGGWLENGAIVLIEQAKREDVMEVPEVFEKLDERIYNITRVTLLKYLG